MADSLLSPGLPRAALVRSLAERTDGELLDLFLEQRSDTAFEALVRRYGPLVFGICRRVLHHAHDTDDAFQATFIVLMRKAPSIRKRDALAAWLHGVAYRIAVRAKSMSVRRQKRERSAADPTLWPDRAGPPAPPAWESALDDAIRRLPAKYRAPLLLCELEGRSRAEAARHLGIPEGTLSSRLARARDLLRRRLVRSGVTVGVGALALLGSAQGAERAVETLVGTLASTGAGPAWVAGLSGNAVTLAETTLKALLLGKLQVTLAIVFGVGLIGPVVEYGARTPTEPPAPVVVIADNVPAPLAVATPVENDSPRVAVEESDDAWDEAEPPAAEAERPAPPDTAARVDAGKKSVIDRLARCQKRSMTLKALYRRTRHSIP
jgi:RNA polymerase sigma-70 factor (ECF subfamily)